MMRGGAPRTSLRASLAVLFAGAAFAITSGCGARSSPHVPGAAADGGAASDAGDAGDLRAALDGGDDGGGDDGTLAEGDAGGATAGPCPDDMVLVESTEPALRYCIDRYEGSLVEIGADGAERPFPNYLPVDGHDVRAVSVPHVFPQGYISEVQADDACSASGKHLCRPDEWKTACMGPQHTTFPYGAQRRPGVCHDTGKSAVVTVFGAAAVAASTPYSPPAASAAPGKTTGKVAGKTPPRKPGTKVQPPQKSVRAAQAVRPRVPRVAPGTKPATAAGKKKLPPRKGPAKSSARPANVDPGVWAKLNDPRLGQVEGGLSRTGEHEECVNGYGVFDMVGNLHEWVATDPQAVHGTFAGGYYLDTTINGDGCLYRTQAHAHDYHDYSTGFRCCSAAEEKAP